jgi:hypothetical protein
MRPWLNTLERILKSNKKSAHLFYITFYCRTRQKGLITWSNQSASRAWSPSPRTHRTQSLATTPRNTLLKQITAPDTGSRSRRPDPWTPTPPPMEPSPAHATASDRDRSPPPPPPAQSSAAAGISSPLAVVCSFWKGAPRSCMVGGVGSNCWAPGSSWDCFICEESRDSQCARPYWLAAVGFVGTRRFELPWYVICKHAFALSIPIYYD